MTHPDLELIRVLTPEEVPQAKADARADYEKRLVGATSKLPTVTQMDSWWCDKMERDHEDWLASIPTADLAGAVAALRDWASVESVPAQEEFDAILARLEELAGA